MMLSISRMQSAIIGRHHQANVCAEPFMLPQISVLTTVEPQTMCSTGLMLPDPVYIAIVECHVSALRAWRNYCGLSIQTLQLRTQMRTATLSAFDHGDVMFCEWTVGALAKALHVEPWQLFKAQLVAVKYQERPEPCERRPGSLGFRGL